MNYLAKIKIDDFEEGTDLLEGDPIEAIKVFEKRIDKYPNESIFFYFMGKAYAIIGDDIKSLEYYDRAIELEPINFLAWRGKGFLLKIKDPHKAIMCLDKSIELYEDAFLWYYKGVILANLGEHKEAVYCLSQALEVEYDHIQDWHFGAWYQKGFSLYELGEYDEAIICFNEAIEIDPNMESAWLGKEKSLLKLGKTNESEKCADVIDKIRDFNPELNEEGRTNEETIRKQISTLNSEIKEKIKEMNYLLKMSPEHFNEGTDLLEGDPIEAIKVFEKRIDEYPNESIFFYFMGEAYAIIGDDIKSLEYYDRAIELEPINFLAWRGKGFLLKIKDPHKAIECIGKSIELHEDEFLWYFKGVLLANLGERKEAVYCLSRALEVEYDHIQDWHFGAWYQKGSCLYNLGEYEEAIICFNEAIEIDPNMESAWLGKGKSLLKLGKTNESEKCADVIDKIRDFKPELNEEGRTNEETIRKQISTLNSEINRLTKDRTEKFSEAGKLAYLECIEKAPELAPDAQTKLDDILAIDTLINKTNQEMKKAKGGKKKSGFLAKLGDAVSSTAKQGKLKVELYNLERKKNSAFTDFGETLYDSYKIGKDSLQELSDTWQAIGDIEQQIHKNDEKIDNLNELLR